MQLVTRDLNCAIDDPIQELDNNTAFACFTLRDVASGCRITHAVVLNLLQSD